MRGKANGTEHKQKSQKPNHLFHLCAQLQRGRDLRGCGAGSGAYPGPGDRYYLADHHEPIVSEEVFEKAQEILHRRSNPRKTDGGKREIFTRKYAFSCLIKCGFCGGTLTRRCWHSGTTHSKVVWQCVEATKGGKKFCPDSKGVEEVQIKKAFVESYKLLCENADGVLEEFLARVEKNL